MSERGSLRHEVAAEAFGTFVLVFFGVGSVHAAVLTGAPGGMWEVAVVWGIAISLAIYTVGAISGAHINPAITIAMAAHKRLPARKVPPYILAQLAGAVVGAVVLYTLFANIIAAFEATNGIERGSPGSELSAMVYGEYFPNPAVAAAQGWSPTAVSRWQAMLAEAVGTAFLACFVFSVTDIHNQGGPGPNLAPVLIGLTVSIVISIVAPLTQAALNPARDFGPRLVAFGAGWGRIAIPGPRCGFFTVYILSPVTGGLVGAAVYQRFIRPGLLHSRVSSERE